jgi:thiosulfate/3-mercaptopyruvate sulfurtransferase
MEIVSVSWLKDHLDDPKLIILDASLSSPIQQSNMNQKIRIQGARKFDLSKNFSNLSSQLPNTMPSAEQFRSEMQHLGICADSIIVVYDQQGIYSSPRAWWMIKSMGHKQVFVLDGGLPVWKGDEFPIEEEKEYSYPIGDFQASERHNFFCDKVYVSNVFDDSDYQIIDARSAVRFLGSTPEPRENLRSGHIRGSINLPFRELLKNDGCLKDKKALHRIFSSIVNKDQQLVLSCGSGVTACILALGAMISGHENMIVYDGSWSEWGLGKKNEI